MRKILIKRVDHWSMGVPMTFTRLWPFADSIAVHKDQKEVSFLTARGMTHSAVLQPGHQYIAVLGLHPDTKEMGRVLEWGPFKAACAVGAALPFAILFTPWILLTVALLAAFFAMFSSAVPILEIRSSDSRYEGYGPKLDIAKLKAARKVKARA